MAALLWGLGAASVAARGAESAGVAAPPVSSASTASTAFPASSATPVQPDGADRPVPSANCPPPVPQPDLSPAAVRDALHRAVDRGLLWRIDKGGRSSWLYGTLHVGKADWVFPGPQVMGALRRSDTLALEVDLSDPAAVRAFTEAPDAEAAARVLTPERRRRLARQAELACLPEKALAALARLRPIMQISTLSVLAVRSDGLYSDLGSETFLAGFAQRSGLRVVGLETVAQQLRALAGDSEAQEGEEIDDGLDELESGQLRRQTETLAEAWARSDRTLLERYEQWCDCVRTPAERRALRRLLQDRNPGLADGIARLHAQGHQVFAAVGALHMLGPQGLPALLAARGFRVTALVPP